MSKLFRQSNINMQDYIKKARNLLNQGKTLTKEYYNTQYSEQCQGIGSYMQKPITLDPPKLFKQTLQVPNMKVQRSTNFNNKLKINTNFRRRSTSQNKEQNSNQIVVQKYNLSFLNQDPLPIVYYNKKGKILRLRKQSLFIIGI